MTLETEKEEQEEEQKPTGIDILDQLTPQQRRELKAQLQQHFNSLTQQEKIEHMNLVHDLIRKKMIEHKGLISQQDALKEYLNDDFPVIIEQAARDVEQTAQKTGDIGYVHVANHLRKTKWGIDAFDVKVRLIDEDQTTGVSVTSSSDPSPAEGEEEE